MTVKQWLWRYSNADHKIESLLRERQDAYDRLVKITTALDGDSVSSTKDPHKFDELAELDVFIRQQVAQSMKIRLEITQAIGKLEDWRHREILTYRYINGYTWEQVADAVYITRRHATRLHGDALIALGKIITDKL